MDHNDHSVYLTFDDGPIPESTPFILQTLKEFGIHATFFMVGDNVRKYPELYKQIVADGHLEERALGARHLDEHRRGRRLGHMAEKLFAQNRIHIG